MVRILSGEDQDGACLGESNVSSGSGTFLVFCVTEIYRPYLRRYLNRKGRTDDKVEEGMEGAEGWDGIFRLLPIQGLRDEHSDA